MQTSFFHQNATASYGDKEEYGGSYGSPARQEFPGSMLSMPHFFAMHNKAIAAYPNQTMGIGVVRGVRL